MVTPIDINKYEQLLMESSCDPVETEFLVNSFRNGLDIGYRGNTKLGDFHQI